MRVVKKVKSPRLISWVYSFHFLFNYISPIYSILFLFKWSRRFVFDLKGFERGRGRRHHSSIGRTGLNVQFFQLTVKWKKKSFHFIGFNSGKRGRGELTFVKIFSKLSITRLVARPLVSIYQLTVSAHRSASAIS